MTVLLAVAWLGNLEKILLFVAMLSVLIVLHEYGHFLIARLSKVRVLEFSVGMGPLIAATRSKKSGTQYSLRALPIGGYCAMHGEDNKTSEGEQQREFRAQQTVTVNGREYDEDNFQAKNPWVRLAIVSAGPFANFILCFLILVITAMTVGVQGDTPRPMIAYVLPGSGADKAGLKVGDRIVTVDGSAVKSGDSLVKYIHGSLNKMLQIQYDRGGTTRTVAIRAMQCPAPNPPNEGCIGFTPLFAYTQPVPFNEAIVDASYGFVNIAVQTIGGLGDLVMHPIRNAPQLSGVVRIGQAAITVQTWGWGYYLGFAAVISFALGIFNLLPLPALDGGRAAFIIAEIARRKPVDPEKEALVHITGFAVLIALMLVINFYNVVQIVQGKGPF
jgi:regulator of sigma E protease